MQPGPRPAGNPGHRALNLNEPQPRAVRIPCPRMLTGPARVEWRRLAPMLRRIGLFTEADREALTALCRAYGEWVGALEELDKTSAVIRAPSGYPVPNPWLSAARAEKRMFKLMVEFGMTPSSRTRIDATPLPAGTRRDLDDEDLLD